MEEMDTSESPIDLEASYVIRQTEKLRDRIAERFPDRTLQRTAGRLVATATESAERVRAIGSRNLALRLTTVILVAAIPAALIWAIAVLRLRVDAIENVRGFVGIFQSGVESLIFIAAGIAFLLTLESRLKRRRALRAIHELRTLAHLVDMHQLDKDPVYALQGGPTTPSSPSRGLGPFELNRYLDYCSEMLSLTGKIAALYGKNIDDSVALSAVDQSETLTTDLSRKIWQKVGLLTGAGPAAFRSGLPPVDGV